MKTTPTPHEHGPAAKLFYLLAIKTTPSATYYSAYEHAPAGLVYVAPVDTSNHKEAQAHGFFYSMSERTAPAAYSIRITERGTNNRFLAAKQLEKILNARHRNTDFLQVAELQTTTPHVFFSNTPKVRSIYVKAFTWRDNVHGNSYYSSIIHFDGKEVLRTPFQNHSTDTSNIKTVSLDYLEQVGLIERLKFPGGGTEQVGGFCRRTGIELEVSTYATTQAKGRKHQAK